MSHVRQDLSSTLTSKSSRSAVPIQNV